jgi:polysaccharide deacetylase family protein (PEP-CTERM system associated)
MSRIIKNAMTVDVEDYFQVSAFEKIIRRQDWDNISCRVEANTNRILDLFSSSYIKATFFMLGWVAERYPELTKRIVDEDHELASHGYEHTRVINQNPSQFRHDIEKTKKILEDISGVEIKGYRAASYSIGEDNLWALKELESAGYTYSSSIYPVKHDLYGMPNAPRFAFHPFGDSGFLEIPITTLKIVNKKFPIGGGGFFRLYPYSVTRWALRAVNNNDKQSGVFYFHPWEIDPGQPKQKGIPLKTRIRHYLNLEKTEQRLIRLLQDFKWDRMDKVFLGGL